MRESAWDRADGSVLLFSSSGNEGVRKGTIRDNLDGPSFYTHIVQKTRENNYNRPFIDA